MLAKFNALLNFAFRRQVLIFHKRAMQSRPEIVAIPQWIVPAEMQELGVRMCAGRGAHFFVEELDPVAKFGGHRDVG